MKNVYFFFTIFLFFSCASEGMKEIEKKVNVLTGADVLVSEKLYLIKDKSVAIVTNPTGVLKNGTHLIDTLHSLGIEIKALFGPEHGLRGEASAGEKVNDGFDDKTGIPVYSLYGKNRKPSARMLKDIDVILFDVQDVGARFYTYISTMYYILSAAAENNKTVIILDRPNPISGTFVDGPMLVPEYKSFVGIAPLPIVHGMTMGELGKYFAGENLLESDNNVDLIIIKCKNWSRNLYYDQTDLTWVKPSPNMPNIETALIYPGTCLIEATNVSEGRGTDKPFLKIGAPFIKSKELIKYLDLSELEGVKFKAVTFTPKTIKGVAVNPKFENQLCQGIEFNITDRSKFNPIVLSINLIYELKRLYPEYFRLKEKWLAKLYGNDSLYVMLQENKTPNEIIRTWKEDLDNFKPIREKYLIYN